MAQGAPLVEPVLKVVVSALREASGKSPEFAAEVGAEGGFDAYAKNLIGEGKPEGSPAEVLEGVRTRFFKKASFSTGPAFMEALSRAEKTFASELGSRARTGLPSLEGFKNSRPRGSPSEGSPQHQSRPERAAPQQQQQRMTQQQQQQSGPPGGPPGPPPSGGGSGTSFWKNLLRDQAARRKALYEKLKADGINPQDALAEAQDTHPPGKIWKVPYPKTPMGVVKPLVGLIAAGYLVKNTPVGTILKDNFIDPVSNYVTRIRGKLGQEGDGGGAYRSGMTQEQFEATHPTQEMRKQYDLAKAQTEGPQIGWLPGSNRDQPSTTATPSTAPKPTSVKSAYEAIQTLSTNSQGILLTDPVWRASGANNLPASIIQSAKEDGIEKLKKRLEDLHVPPANIPSMVDDVRIYIEKQDKMLKNLSPSEKESMRANRPEYMIGVPVSMTTQPGSRTAALAGIKSEQAEIIHTPDGGATTTKAVESERTLRSPLKPELG